MRISEQNLTGGRKPVSTVATKVDENNKSAVDTVIEVLVKGQQPNASPTDLDLTNCTFTVTGGVPSRQLRRLLEILIPTRDPVRYTKAILELRPGSPPQPEAQDAGKAASAQAVAKVSLKEVLVYAFLDGHGDILWIEFLQPWISIPRRIGLEQAFDPQTGPAYRWCMRLLAALAAVLVGLGIAMDKDRLSVMLDYAFNWLMDTGDHFSRLMSKHAMVIPFGLAWNLSKLVVMLGWTYIDPNRTDKTKRKDLLTIAAATLCSFLAVLGHYVFRGYFNPATIVFMVVSTAVEYLRLGFYYHNAQKKLYDNSRSGKRRIPSLTEGDIKDYKFIKAILEQDNEKNLSEAHKNTLRQLLGDAFTQNIQNYGQLKHLFDPELHAHCPHSTHRKLQDLGIVPSTVIPNRFTNSDEPITVGKALGRLQRLEARRSQYIRNFYSYQFTIEDMKIRAFFNTIVLALVILWLVLPPTALMSGGCILGMVACQIVTWRLTRNKTFKQCDAISANLSNQDWTIPDTAKTESTYWRFFGSRINRWVSGTQGQEVAPDDEWRLSDSDDSDGENDRRTERADSNDSLQGDVVVVSPTSCPALT